MRARVRQSGTYYYYDTGERELPLGSDYMQAVLKWAELEGGNARKKLNVTFKDVAESYLASEHFKRKAPRSKKDNLNELEWLYKFFDNPPAPFEKIEPHHIAKYRDWRKSTHSTHDIALVSAIWSWAREQGITSLANPTTGVERNRGPGRDVYVDDEMFKNVYRWADLPTRDAMDLAHLAGQRPGDCLKMLETDIRDGALWVSQGKTKAKVRIAIIGKLAEVIERIQKRKARIVGRVRSLHLVVNEKGAALTASALDGRFGWARDAANIKPLDFQFRDLRAKAATEVDDQHDIKTAQTLLGHTSEQMTRTYVRRRIGKLVNPTK